MAPSFQQPPALFSASALAAAANEHESILAVDQDPQTELMAGNNDNDGGIASSSSHPFLSITYDRYDDEESNDNGALDAIPEGYSGKNREKELYDYALTAIDEAYDIVYDIKSCLPESTTKVSSQPNRRFLWSFLSQQHISLLPLPSPNLCPVQA